MFTIRLRTLKYRPDLQVTIRASVDGWQEDFAGNYEGDAWIFRLADQLADYGQDVLLLEAGSREGCNRSAGKTIARNS